MIGFFKKHIFNGATRNPSAPYILVIFLCYLLVSIVYYILFFSVEELLTRSFLTVTMITSFILLDRSKLRADILSFLSPTIAVMHITIGAVWFNGDFLIFVYTIGGAMIAMTYLKPKGMIWHVIAISIMQLIFLLSGRNLMGVNFSAAQNYLGLIGGALINYALYHFSKQYSTTLNSLTEARNLADKSAQAKTEFLANISHEIRTPLNAIIGITQMEMQKNEPSADKSKSLPRILGSATNLLGIINDILDLSKIDTGNLELHVSKYDIPKLINESVHLNTIKIGTKPIKFILHVDPNLPQKLIGDELRLKQILNNLLSNAIKYTDKGHVRMSVVHGYANEKPLLEFIIEDTGQGLSVEDQTNLFSEYTRFNAQVNKFTEGTGLGLNITRSLVKMMNGSISVKSEFGKGSTFRVIVYQEQVPEEVDSIGKKIAWQLESLAYNDEMTETNMKMDYVQMTGKRVLIVDDTESNLYVAAGLLNPYNLHIETVTDGFEAIARVSAMNVYDIIFMDHMMPHLNGIETTKRIRAFGYMGPIVALTANALIGNAEMFMRNGFDGFLSKPIDIWELDIILKKFITVTKSADVVSGEIPINPKIKAAFARDAAKAINAITNSYKEKDLNLFTITVHGMKSALASINEPEASEFAASLEAAGKSSQWDIIDEKHQELIDMLKKIIIKYEALS